VKIVLRQWLLIACVWIAVAGYSQPSTAQAAVLQAQKQAAKTTDIALPLQSNSVRFAVIGDSGTGDGPQYDVAQRMKASHDKVSFNFVIMLGDNIYGGHSPEDFARKFETPYKPLLDAGVKFYASLGNHDDPNLERLYKPFNMNGERYYTFKKGDVQFFALDSNYMDPAQLGWLNQNLQNSKSKWKICYFHHPLYSDGKHHGADVDLRAQLVPLFQRYGVNAVFSGHEHVYQRMKPQDGICYFVLGNSGKLMTNDFKTTKDLDKSFDTDLSFMLVEIAGDTLYYQTIARNGETIDSGSVVRQSQSAAAAAH
jgi:hypothetical protein